MEFLSKHLQSVGESYFQHARHAASFAAYMFVGCLACLGHAIFPFLFERTGSDIIRRLHDRMVVNRHQLTPKAPLSVAPESLTARR
jgi:hypothetical protein